MMLSSEKYMEIRKRLDLNFRDDEKARDVLDGLIDSGDYSIVEDLIKGRIALVFGCGPSLRGDVKNLKKAGLPAGTVLIAADGAVEALLEEGIVPNLCITDLDGNLDALKKADEKGCIMIVHAHGDNIGLLREVVPHFKHKLGSTQVKETEKIKNHGGFTDGDRCVHLATHYQAKKIILYGMDYTEKTEKMKIGRELLEELAKNTTIPIINATGEDYSFNSESNKST